MNLPSSLIIRDLLLHLYKNQKPDKFTFLSAIFVTVYSLYLMKKSYREDTI